MALAVALVGTPGEAVSAVKRVVFADKAGSVNGIKASKKPKAGRLLALDKKKKFPRSVLPSGLNGAQGPKGNPGPQGPAGSATLTDGSVTGAKLAPETIDGSRIANGSITGSDIGVEEVSGLSILDGSVTPAELSNRAQPHWVEVNADGTIADQSDGYFSVTRNGTGQYSVTNGIVPLAQCATTVTRLAVFTGEVSVGSGTGNTEVVWMAASSGAAQDRAF